MSEENWMRYKTDAKIAFIDCETFNLNLHFSVNRPWQIGVLKVEGERLLESIDAHINWPDCPFSIGRGAAMITHFNKLEHDKVATDPITAFNKFWPVLEWADYIIGHNLLRFDIYLLRGYAQYMNRDWKFLMPKIIDMKPFFQGMKLNRPYRPGEDDLMEYQYKYANDCTKGVKTRLEIVAKEYGIAYDYENLHDGVKDILLSKLVWDRLKMQIEL